MPTDSRRKVRNHSRPYRKRGHLYHLDVQINGRRYRESLGTGNERLARKKAFERMEEIRLYTGVATAEGMTVEAAYNAWIEYRELEGGSKISLKGYEDGRKRLVDGFPRLISKVTPSDIAKWRTKILTRVKNGEIKAPTANSYMRPVRTCLNWCTDQGYLDFRPKLKPMPEPRTKRVVFLDHEMEELLRLIKGEPLEAIVILAGYAGLRLHEIGSLHWGEIDVKQRKIHIIRGKGDKERHARLRKIGVAAIEKLPKGKKDDLVLGGKFTPPVNPSRDEYRNFRTRLSREFKKMMDRCVPEESPLSKARPHQLRHTYTTQCIDAGVPIGRVAESLGHGVAYVTQRYFHPTEGDFDA